MSTKQNLPDLHTILELQRCIAEYDDAVAYKKLFFYFFLPLKSFAVSIIKSNDLAEEIVSDVFLEIWVRRRQLYKIENLKMYFYVSVRNAALRKLKQLKKMSTVSLEDMQVDLASVEPDAEAKLVTAELSQKIKAAVDQLPPQCKIIYKLAKEDKLKYKEISQLLNISVKTIDNQIFTALKKIANSLNTSSKHKTR